MSVARRAAPNALDPFVRGYVEGALEYFGRRRHGTKVADIDPDAMEELVNRAARFYDSNWHLIEQARQSNAIDEGITEDVTTVFERAGRHFFFTSNAITNYFDRSSDWGKQGPMLSKRAEAFGDRYGAYELALGDDDVVVGVKL